MAQLHRLTRGMTSPQGKPRVYFCCHPEDHSRYFDTLTKDILRISDCAIYYYDPAQPPDAARTEDLSMMQLFVVPISARLLQGGSPATDIDLPFALREHIPVLPLMQEGGLEQPFARVFGDLQFLDRNQRDVTTLPYEEKLRKYLDTVLVGDETAKKVRAAFDAYVFLSYRKKNRREAQELMRLVHQNEACRDIAIWYDEFLTPGEDFQDAIRLAMHKSSLFLLVVTPDLLEKDNYVAAHEYPEAVRNHTTIVPVEMRATEKQPLAAMYPALPDCANPHDSASLRRALTDALQHIVLREHTSPEHDFFIGLAYLEGIDVEVDADRAMRLIRSAAEAGITEAVEKLLTMYALGQGVPRDAAAATEWKQQLILCRIRDFRNDPTEQNTLLMLDEQRDLADVLVRTDAVEQAVQLYTQVAEVSQTLSEHFPSARASQHRAAALLCLGTVCRQRGQAQQALEHFREAERWLLDALAKRGVNVGPKSLTVSDSEDFMNVVLLSDLCVCLCGLGDVLVERGQQRRSVEDMQNAQTCYDRVLAYLQSEHLKDRFAGYPQHLSVIYERLGNMAYCRADDDGARRYYELALRIDEQRLQDVHETHDNEAWDSYAVSCFRLATVDPGHPDRAYLEKACEVWREMVRLAPELTIYAERLREAERLLRSLSQQATEPPKPAPQPISDPNPVSKPIEKSQPAPAPKEPTAEEKFAALLARAEEGDKEAQYEVASCYFKGEGTEKDFAKAADFASKSILGDARKLPHAEAAYIMIVYCMFDLPENYVGFSNYTNASGWARSAARFGYFGPIGTMEIRCGYGRYKSVWRVLYWKLYGVFARSRYPKRRRRR